MSPYLYFQEHDVQNTYLYGIQSLATENTHRKCLSTNTNLTLMKVSPIILLFSSGSAVTFKVLVICFFTADWSFLPDITVVLL